MANTATHTDRVRAVFTANPNKAFTNEEMAAETGLAQDKVAVMNSRLVSQREVRRVAQGTYQLLHSGSGRSRANGSSKVSRSAGAAKSAKRSAKKATRKHVKRTTTKARATSPSTSNAASGMKSFKPLSEISGGSGMLLMDQDGKFWVAQPAEVVPVSL